MDTSTGKMYTPGELEEALRENKVEKDNIVKLPQGVVEKLSSMNRKERRAWYKENRKRLNLPRWNEIGGGNYE